MIPVSTRLTSHLLAAVKRCKMHTMKVLVVE